MRRKAPLVRLDRPARSIEIADEITGGSRDIRLAFHLGPEVQADLEGSVATLHWLGGAAQLTLPGQLEWNLHRAETDPILGWYSAGLGHRVPAWTLLGVGRSTADNPLITLLRFTQSDDMTGPISAHQTVPLSKANANAALKGAPGSQAEAG